MITPKAERHVSTSRVIAAPAQEIFEVLADPAKHSIIDGSGSLVEAKGNPPRLFLGAKFGMKMSFHATMRNKVVEFEDGKQIGWRHIGQHVWRYELEPVEGGTKVRNLRLATEPAPVASPATRHPHEESCVDGKNPRAARHLCNNWERAGILNS